jgi:hypothetical protein
MVLVMTLGFARHGFVRESVEYFQARSDRSEYDEHVVVDLEYPLPSAEENSDRLQKLALEKRLSYMKLPNLGVAKNWQQVVERYRLQDTDTLVGVCPDTRGEHPGWVRAGVEVLQADPDCFTVQLNRYGDYRPYNPEVRRVGSHNVVRFPQLVAWSTGMFNMRHINEIGGFEAWNPYYGWSEHYLVEKLLPMGRHWCFLKDHYDAGLPSPDPDYTQWKIESAGGVTKSSFEDWLKAKQA